MASLHHHAAVLLTFGLLIGCGGDRSRAGTSMDTTGAAAVTPDSAAMPTSDSASASRGTTPAAAPAATDTAKRPSAVAPARTPPAKAATRPVSPPVKKPAAAARPAPDTSAAPTQPADSGKTASAAAPAAKPQQQDTSTQTAEAPLIDAYHQAPHDTVSEAVYDGWKQFNLNCARCHGEDALGTTIAPHLILSLKPDGPINTKELFVQTVCAGRPTKGMPSWCALGLGIDKINDIYLYVKGRSDAKISPGRPAVKRAG
ncbi:MAG: c-type cytochrome [Gemmatimonadales bacterium]